MRTTRSGRAPLLVLVWLLGVVVATGSGLLAVRQVGDQVGDRPVPTVEPSELAALPSTPPVTPVPPTVAAATPSVPPGTARPSRSTTSAPRTSAPRTSAPATFSGTGGAVGVRCVATTARLLYASPAQGWSVDQQESSGSSLEVRFEREQGEQRTRVRVRVSCASGTPALVERRTDTSGSG